MKKIAFYLFLLITTVAFAQQNYNTTKGLGAKGYDVVAYFGNHAEKGNKDFTASYDGVTYRFASERNLQEFKKTPKKYIPQYGGYCAYAIGKTGEKVDINPKTFEIRDGKLYLFYNSWGTNTLKFWQDENPDELQQQADKNWRSISK